MYTIFCKKGLFVINLEYKLNAIAVLYLINLLILFLPYLSNCIQKRLSQDFSCQSLVSYASRKNFCNGMISTALIQDCSYSPIRTLCFIICLPLRETYIGLGVAYVRPSVRASVRNASLVRAISPRILNVEFSNFFPKNILTEVVQ